MEPHKAGYLDINGIQLYHEIYGEGKPVVLVHGGGSSIRLDFQEVINRLHHHFMLIGIDLQNHGKSDHREISETFEQDAKDIAAVLDKLNIEKASFLVSAMVQQVL